MKISKSKLVAVGISVVVASTAAGAANNYMAKDEPVEQPKTEKTVDNTSDEKTEEVKKVPADRIGDEHAPDTTAPDTTSPDTTSPEPTVQNPNPSEDTPEPVEVPVAEAQPTKIPVEYVETPPVEVPVINPLRIVLTEVTDYPNPRYPDRVDQKCIHHMEDGTSRWMVSTVRIKDGNLCLPSGKVMSKAQYIQFRTDEIPVQWR